MNDKQRLKDLEKRVLILEEMVMPDKDKVVKGKDLQKTRMRDIMPWLEKKRDEGKIFTISLSEELSNCRDHFINKKRTISTAYTWLNTAQKREDKENPPKKSKNYDLLDDIKGGGING